MAEFVHEWRSSPPCRRDPPTRPRQDISGGDGGVAPNLLQHRAGRGLVRAVASAHPGGRLCHLGDPSKSRHVLGLRAVAKDEERVFRLAFGSSGTTEEDASSS